MGLDILLYAEQQRATAWHLCGELEENHEHMTEAEHIEPAYRPQSLYTLRNTALFHILGMPQQDAATVWTPIAPPRGLPPDLSGELVAWATYWPEGRWASWLSLDEVLAFDWHGKSVVRHGMVPEHLEHLFGDGQQPFPLSSWPSGQPITHAEQRVGWVTVTWRETYAETAGTAFLDGVIGQLKTMDDSGRLRLVFWFN